MRRPIKIIEARDLYPYTKPNQEIATSVSEDNDLRLAVFNSDDGASVIYLSKKEVDSLISDLQECSKVMK